MKKVLLTAAFALVAAFSYGQVTIDWSIDQIAAPTSFTSSSTTGTTVTYDLVAKNLGTDSAKIGDTVLYQMAIIDASSNVVVIAPASGQFYFKLLTKNMASGDTLHIKGQFTFLKWVSASQNVTFGAISHIVQRGRGLNFEGTSTSTNNTKTAAAIWYNPQGWPVSVANPAVSSAAVYPTVCNAKFNVTLQILSTNESASISLYDMTGRLVTSQTLAPGKTNAEVSTDCLANGTYIVKVQSGAMEQTTRVIVQK